MHAKCQALGCHKGILPRFIFCRTHSALVLSGTKGTLLRKLPGTPEWNVAFAAAQREIRHLGAIEAILSPDHGGSG